MSSSKPAWMMVAFAAWTLAAACGPRHLLLQDIPAPQQPMQLPSESAAAGGFSAEVAGPAPAVASCTRTRGCYFANEYCVYATLGACQTGVGSCKRRPDACGDASPPVCGCDGKQYLNVCALRAPAEIFSAKPGECAGPGDDAGTPDAGIS